MNRRPFVLAAIVCAQFALGMRLLLGGAPLWGVSAVILGPYVVALVGLVGTWPRRRKLADLAKRMEASEGATIVVPFATPELMRKFGASGSRDALLTDKERRALKKGFVALFSPEGLDLYIPDSNIGSRLAMSLPATSIRAVSVKEGFLPDSLSDRKLIVRTAAAELAIPLYSGAWNYSSMSRANVLLLKKKIRRMLPCSDGDSWTVQTGRVA